MTSDDHPAHAGSQSPGRESPGRESPGRESPGRESLGGESPGGDISPATADLAAYGPWAVITGGSEGVGSAMAELLARAGVNLVLSARRPGPLAETAERVRGFGIEVRTRTLDLADPAAVDELIDATADLEVGLLVHNAGANSYGHDFVTGDLSRVNQVIALNVHTPLALVHHFAAPMRERRRGGVLLVGSLAGYLGQAQISVYSATKSFIRTFAEGLWLELREHGVDVVDVVLGVTRTPAMERAGLNLDAPGMVVSDPAEVAAEALASLPHGPVHVIGDHRDAAAHRSGTDRAALALDAQRASARLLPPPSR